LYGLKQSFMPKSSLQLALARQWELLKKLPPRGPGLTASQITAWLKEQGYPVSKRTVERDLIELSASFGIRCNDKSTPYGSVPVKLVNLR
jgi:hypothetical protein